MNQKRMIKIIMFTRFKELSVKNFNKLIEYELNKKI